MPASQLPVLRPQSWASFGYRVTGQPGGVCSSHLDSTLPAECSVCLPQPCPSQDYVMLATGFSGPMAGQYRLGRWTTQRLTGQGGGC